MTDKVFEEIQAMIKLPQCPNMFDIPAVFELALECGFDSLADYVFHSTSSYSAFTISGKRE